MLAWLKRLFGRKGITHSRSFPERKPVHFGDSHHANTKKQEKPGKPFPVSSFVHPDPAWNLFHRMDMVYDALGWSLRRLAKETGIPQSTLSGFRAGVRPGPKNQKKLEAWLEDIEKRWDEISTFN